MNIKVISVNVGRALLVSALFMFLAMLVSFFSGMDSSFGPLAISFIITFIFGIFPFIFVRQTGKISIREGFLIVVLSWLLSFIFGMLPYVLWGGEFTLVNAWFESVSGFTTTGATILTDIESLPRGLIFWRSATHFIGGLGVVVLLLLVLPSASPFRLRLTNIELSSLSKEGYRYRAGRTVYVIVSVYLGIFVLCAISLFLAGMDGFDAVNHAFSVVATGGFSTRNLSISSYNSLTINLIVTFFTLLSTLHYGLIFTAIVTRSLRPFKRNPVVKYYFGVIAALTVLAAISLKIYGGYESWGKAAADSFFQVCSYITTTGLGMSDNSQWPFMAGAILILASLHCGCSGSTSGGIKADRVYIALRTLARQLKLCLHPTAVFKVRAGEHYLDDRETLPVLIYILIYVIIIIVSIFLLMLCGVDTIDAVSGSVASMGNVGIALGNIGSLGTYAFQPMIAKIIYTVEMVFGRLEVYPLLMIFLVFKKDR